MARLVEHDAKSPVEIKAGGESKWICMCGLSRNEPYCDGSHKKTVDEEAGKVYIYDKEGRRVEV